MITWIDISKILAGVAIFLIAVRFLEESLQKMSGRRFNLFLRKQTSSKIRAIAGGAVVTGVLQKISRMPCRTSNNYGILPMILSMILTSIPGTRRMIL